MTLVAPRIESTSKKCGECKATLVVTFDALDRPRSRCPHCDGVSQIPCGAGTLAPLHSMARRRAEAPPPITEPAELATRGPSTYARAVIAHAAPIGTVMDRGPVRASGPTVRARILMELAADTGTAAPAAIGTTVGQVAAAMGREASVISAHLLQLCESGRVRRERRHNPAYPNVQGARPMVWMYWRIA